MSIGLKTGLEYFIKKVENLHDDTIFEMCNYNQCVIGQTFGWSKFDGESVKSGDDYGYWDVRENYILTRRFGMKKISGDVDRFSSSSQEYYTDRQWSVIRLFTADVGYELTKQEWLNIAKSQLESMK